jgi:hypothetical protein
LPGDQQYESKNHANINHCYIRYQDDESAEKCLFFEGKHSIKNKDDLKVVRAFKIGQNDETDKKLFLKISPVVQFDAPKLEKYFNVNIFFTLGLFQEIRRAQRKDQD